MKKKKPAGTLNKVAFTLKDLGKILFTKDDAYLLEQRMNEKFGSLEQRLVRIEETKADKRDLESSARRLESKLATKEDLKLLEKQIGHVTFEEHAPVLENHEERLVKLEKTVFSA